MNPDELRRMAGKFRMPVGTLEKDYAVTVLLSMVSRFPAISAMVFKGGTAIKKVYFAEARFSEDLDFTCSRDVSKGLIVFLRRETERASDIEFTEVKLDSSGKYGKRISVKYNDFNGHPNSIKIDIRLGEKVINPVKSRKIIHIYNLGEFATPSMHIGEIMAEKIRAIIYSKQPRHLYDMWFLFRKKIPLAPALVRYKIKSYGEKFDIEKLEASIQGMGREWSVDLQPLLPQVPSFQSVARSVTTKIRKIMKQP